MAPSKGYDHLTTPVNTDECDSEVDPQAEAAADMKHVELHTGALSIAQL